MVWVEIRDFLGNVVSQRSTDRNRLVQDQVVRSSPKTRSQFENPGSGRLWIPGCKHYIWVGLSFIRENVGSVARTGPKKSEGM